MKKIVIFAALLFSLSCSKDEAEVRPPEPQVAETPVAVDDAVLATQNEELILSGLLENDDLVGDARIDSFDHQTTKGGEIVDNRDGTYTYTPPTDFLGEDSFSYTICALGDTERCSTALVSITVTDAGEPVAVNDSYETQEEKSLTITSHLENDELLDNALLASVEADQSEGTVTILEDGSLEYTPDAGFSGEDSFTYSICDDDEQPFCSTATITVLVNDEGSPAASDDSVVVSSESTGIKLGELLLNDVLTDDGIMTSLDVSTTAGTASLDEDGIVTYVPATSFTGTDTFSYRLCDDDAEPTCATATVTVTVVEPMSFNIPPELQDYYQELALSSNQEANFEFLSDFISDKHTNILSYGERHEYLYEADEDLDNPENVILMYSGESRYWEEYSSGSNSYSPQTFNTEHVYPQSKLVSNAAVTDLHHLRVADEGINSQRLNYPFVEGSGQYGLVGEEAWYPGDEWKGDVARMIMYLNIRYGENFEKVGTLDLFLKWNRLDPVSAFEIQRNNIIETAQGNRNPFIDNPFLATLLWGGEPAENKW